MNEKHLKILKAASEVTAVSLDDILAGPKVPRTMTARVLATYALRHSGLNGRKRSHRTIARIMGVTTGSISYRLAQYRSWVEVDAEFKELTRKISTML